MIRARIRSTGERGVGWFILLSLSLHGLFLVVVLLHKKPVSLGYQAATTVDLVSENVLRPSAPPPQQKPSAHRSTGSSRGSWEFIPGFWDWEP